MEGLFAAALRLGLTRDLDWLCRRAALHDSHGLPADALLFVNVGIPALLDPLHPVDQMLLLLRWAGRSPADIVLELSEREAVTDMERFTEVLAAYRSEGFRFALDDVGEGHSTLEVLAQGVPEYIKIARQLTRRAGSAGPRSAIQALATFARDSGARLIAEGIEDNADIEVMRGLGVELGQGYALGRPGRQYGRSSAWRRRGSCGYFLTRSGPDGLRPSGIVSTASGWQIRRTSCRIQKTRLQPFVRRSITIRTWAVLAH